MSETCTYTITLSEAEHATVLAALRCWQRVGAGAVDAPEYIIASNDGLCAPLDAEDIDDLCERINFADAEPGDPAWDTDGNCRHAWIHSWSTAAQTERAYCVLCGQDGDA